MTQVCQICSNPKRLEIDRELVKGGNVSQLARKYNVPGDSLYYHRDNHLSRQLVQAWKQKELTESLNLLGRIEDLLTKAETIFNRNYEAKKDSLALKALGEQRSTIELLAKIAAYLHEARAMELQAKNQNEEREREFKNALKVLTDPELAMLEKLEKKLKTQDAKMVIIPDKPEPELPTNVGTNVPTDSTPQEDGEIGEKPTKTEAEEEKPEGNQQLTLVEPVKLQPYRKKPRKYIKPRRR